MNIRWVGSPNFSARRDGEPRALILHIMEGSLLGCDSWFDGTQNAETSAHFGIGKFGDEQHQYVLVSNAAHANGITDGANPPDHGHARAFLAGIPVGASPNRYSIAIECEGWPGEGLWGDLLTGVTAVAYMLFCRGGAHCPHGQGAVYPDGHGSLSASPCDRDHVLLHSEIGGHPECPGYSEIEVALLIAHVNALLDGVTSTQAAVIGQTSVQEDEMAGFVEVVGSDNIAALNDAAAGALGALVGGSAGVSGGLEAFLRKNPTGDFDYMVRHIPAAAFKDIAGIAGMA